MEEHPLIPAALPEFSFTLVFKSSVENEQTCSRETAIPSFATSNSDLGEIMASAAQGGHPMRHNNSMHGTSSLVWQGQGQASASSVQQDKAQNQLQSALQTAQKLTRTRRRLLPCLWRKNVPCSANLASIDILEQHLQAHLRRPNNTGEGSKHRCHWDRCETRFPDYERLHEHLGLHITRLAEEVCPYARCSKRKIPAGKFAAHITDTHLSEPEAATPRPSNRLRRSRPPGTKVPLVHILPVPAYLLSTPTVSPHWPMKTGAPMSRSRSEQASKSPILPGRDDESIPFYPTCGDAYNDGEADSRTSSIFPPLDDYRQDTPTLLPILRVAKNRERTPFSVANRQTRRPTLFTGVLPYLRRQRELKAKTAVLDAPTPILESIGREQAALVAAASRQRAVETVGRSLGIDHMEEMIAFERRGIELGILPADYDLRH